MFEARLSDNILTPGPAFVNGTEPGEYQLTTPGPPAPVNTGASSWLPFAMRSASQFRPGAPPALTSRLYTRDLRETQEVGGSFSDERTPDQEASARWHTEMAQFQFNRIANAEVQTDGRSLLEHARLFALLNMAMADAVTAVFDAKYTYLFWRPSTAIHNADVDGNPRTEVDPSWAPFLTTPPHPDTRQPTALSRVPAHACSRGISAAATSSRRRHQPCPASSESTGASTTSPGKEPLRGSSAACISVTRS